MTRPVVPAPAEASARRAAAESAEPRSLELARVRAEAFTVRRVRGMFRLPMRYLSKLVGLAVLGMIACGRPATEQECNEILTRTATLEYQTASKAAGPVDPAQIETIRARLKDSMMRNCVGKRITAKAMNCVRTAKTAKEIEERCFD